MQPYYDEGGVTIYHGDCRGVMERLPVPVDAIVTDPPYGLGFMGQKWDALPPGREWGEACLRALKPGGHLLAFGGTRTYHRLACAIEDAGFEIRDTIAWLYGSGFPKSLDVSKAIDKAAGAERQVVGRASGAATTQTESLGAFAPEYDKTIPATPEAERWQGWGTALKPAHEPIVVARKPLAGTVAANVLEHGTGALNIDGCRIESGNDYHELEVVQGGNHRHDVGLTEKTRHAPFEPASGRWPANVVLNEEAAGLLDEQTGKLHAAGNRPETTGGAARGDVSMFGLGFDGPSVVYADSGGASRFFYCAKASRRERGADNLHPTVKPLTLMRWLVRLVSPGSVLDPFMGSGSTLLAAQAEGRRAIGIEIEERYCEIAAKRLAQRVLDLAA